MINWNDTWETKYRNATVATIHYALMDIKKTLDIYKDTDNDYTRKLWSEWDYLLRLKAKS